MKMLNSFKNSFSSSFKPFVSPITNTDKPDTPSITSEQKKNS